MEINPSYTQAHLWYASAVSNPPFNKPEESVEVLENVLTMDPLSRVARNNIAANLAQMGKFEEAETQWRAAIALDPDYDTTYIALYFLYSNSYYRHDEALTWLERAYEAAPDDTGNAANFVSLYFELDMDDEAEKWATHVQDSAPNHPISQLIPSFASSFVMFSFWIFISLDVAWSLYLVLL